jgi:hypothetical protein
MNANEWKIVWAGCGTDESKQVSFAYILQEYSGRRRLLLCLDAEQILVTDTLPMSEMMLEDNTLDSNQPILGPNKTITTATSHVLHLYRIETNRETKILLRALNLVFQRYEKKISTLIDDVNFRVQRVNDIVHKLANIFDT